MRPVTLLFSILISINVFGQDQPMAEVVSHFGAGSLAAIQADYKRLARDPKVSIELLVNNLKMVEVHRFEFPEREVDSSSFSSANQMIWDIRALECLTGRSFTAPTTYKFNERGDDRIRHSILTARTERYSQEVSFFGLRTSVGVFYFAPHDAQQSIIRKWKEWAGVELKEGFVPKSTELIW